MEKEEHKEYMEKLNAKYERFKALSSDAMMIQLDVDTISESVKKVDKYLEKIEDFKNSVSKSFSNSGDAQVLVFIAHHDNDVKELIDFACLTNIHLLCHYGTGNYDEILYDVEEKLYNDLQNCLYHIGNSQRKVTEILKRWNSDPIKSE